ncbi:MAG: hypothetical protein WBD40_24585, partial [Tepidisphaeraceae bacterium]
MLFADTILFIRGATRSGGFLEASEAGARNLQLADINDASTASQNTGWGTLAQALRDEGFVVEQMIEPKGANAPATGFVDGRPIRFEELDLTKYAAIVFASNNARYAKPSIDAIENYVKGGGGALFISDANFGSNWADAPTSDQQFLDRFGLTVNQDNGVYSLTRTGGDFAAADHPVLIGVDEFDGEGVSPVVVPQTPPAGVTITRVVGARTQTRNNNGDPGSLRPVTNRDAALVLATVGDGRVATYFDRNTFFNDNGRGSDITRFDNRQLAVNLFTWIADNTPPAATDATFTQGAPSEVRITFNDNLFGTLTRRDVLLRNAIDGTAIPRERWSFLATDSPEGTELLVRVKGAQPPGVYQLQINPGRIWDDSGNPSVARVRFNFTIADVSSVIATAHDERGLGVSPEQSPGAPGLRRR